MRERILSINPAAEVVAHKCFYLPGTQAQFDFTNYDYVVDAIDTVAGKIALVLQAEASGTPIISSMGAGNKLDATAFRVADIYQTSGCPLARVMRKELKKRGVKKLKVVYSEELPLKGRNGEEADRSAGDETDTEKEAVRTVSSRRSIPGSAAFVPSVAGLIIAGEVVKYLIN